MGKWISNFNTTAEFATFSGTTEFSTPHVSLTKDNDEVLFMKPIGIWVDEFKPEHFYELPYFINDPESMGSMLFVYTNSTFNVGGVNYYLWKKTKGNDCHDCDILHKEYLLTTSVDYNTLKQQSLAVNNSNNFTSFYAFLDEDNETEYANDEAQKLIKMSDDDIAYPIQVLKLWIDDFPEDYVEEPIEDFVDDPEGMGCNPYILTNIIEIEGTNYYLWEYVGDNYSEDIKYLLTTSGDYNTLYNQSLYNDIDMDSFPAFYSFMSEDSELYNEGDDSQRLVKVERL